MRIDIDLAQRLRLGTPYGPALGTVVADLPPSEDENRSAEGPDASRGGPEGTALVLHRLPGPRLGKPGAVRQASYAGVCSLTSHGIRQVERSGRGGQSLYWDGL